VFGRESEECVNHLLFVMQDAVALFGGRRSDRLGPKPERVAEYSPEFALTGDY
jgi:hypothetical protein